MQAAMDRLERLVARRRRLVLGIWIGLLVVAVPFASQQTKNLTGGGFENKGSGSQLAAEELKDIPGAQSETLAVVFDNRKLQAGELAVALAEVRREAFKDVEGVKLDYPAYLKARGEQDQPIVVMPLKVTASRDQAVDDAAQIRLNLGIDDQKDATVPLHLVGQGALWAGMQELSKQDLEQAEFIGLPIVLIVLLVVFGSLAAAALPLALGVVSVTLTGAVVYFLSQTMEMSIFVTNMASMLGIGVAVDYSLFILARYREELKAGLTHEAARETAMRTSGMAVVFSGVTVIVALSGLFLIDAKVVRSMAIGAIVVVAIAVLAAVSLLPALITILGRRVSEPGKIVGKLRRNRVAKTGPGFWERWTATLMKRPLPFAIGATVLMLLIASPALSLKLDNAAIAQFPKDFETRVGFDLAAQATSAGAMGPIQYVVTGASPAELAQIGATLKQQRDVAQVLAPLSSKDGRRTLFTIVPAKAPESAETYALVDRLRDAPLPAGATAVVGGAAAQNQDFSALVNGSLWKVAVFVMVLSFVVLLLVLRSVILPIKAVLMNVLSVAAAYGVLVMVFQWGWFDWTGFEHLGYVQAITPALLLAIVFGLSMDYEVFMLSRIKERYQATGDNRQAVAQGLSASAKTISSAALIMVAVFAIFAGTGVPQIKEIGVGLAVAIALDATVVRLILVPTTMELMGNWNWWLPKWLDRILPDMDFESSGSGAAPEEAQEEPALAAR
ncbi:MMPL family transporter [Solirubrobacter ginsenosidimutans]|uniref:MMPL family transporter n=1 Tax=Solirubrobacter ginsenosidimutans TaxID=490573 RepID=A0A9X3MUW9_9ACTN|nr:MMPL family transporter [Solirubrobacter ginsenosidimutans]MDA0162386.1 MMPL family transporter [Solirubrobacter ginsenosidimutans]